MPRKPEDRRSEDAPRTDLPPEKEPYYEGYFGTDEEEGAVREREASGDEGGAERERRSSPEDAAGGDREI
jgi:hypothetical protein